MTPVSQPPVQFRTSGGLIATLTPAGVGAIVTALVMRFLAPGPTDDVARDARECKSAINELTQDVRRREAADLERWQRLDSQVSLLMIRTDPARR